MVDVTEKASLARTARRRRDPRLHRDLAHIKTHAEKGDVLAVAQVGASRRQAQLGDDSHVPSLPDRR